MKTKLTKWRLPKDLMPLLSDIPPEYYAVTTAIMALSGAENHRPVGELQALLRHFVSQGWCFGQSLEAAMKNFGLSQKRYQMIMSADPAISVANAMWPLV